MKEQEIGELFRDNLAGYQPQPSADLWSGIQQDAVLKKFNRGRRLRRLALRVGLPVLIATVATVAVIALWPSSPAPSAPAPATPDKTIVATAIADTTAATPPATVLSVGNRSAANTPQATSPAVMPTAVVLPTAVTETAVPTASPLAVDVQETDITPAPADEITPTAPLAQIATKGKEGIHNVKEAQHNTTTQASNDLQTKEDFRLIYSHDTMVCRNSKVQLYVLNADNVFWSFGSQNPTEELIIEEQTLVRADVRTKDGIDTSIIVNIRVYDCELFIPSAFTPNGDGLNDEWMVYAPAGISDFECTIYDKGGHMLFRSTNIHYGWNGMVDGKYLPTGGYFYDCRFRDELGKKHVQKGQVTLVR
ncbi:MAG: gliding motility-associated C-terminal domain-containing protein [Bacteroidales bacterium]|nr:gliding motility-associated C-terminal domain-containing protein [Bacteroidales bacterium]